MKRFLCIWTSGYDNNISTKDIGHFTTDNGYTNDSIRKVQSMSVNELVDLTDMSGTHFVKRIE